MWTRMRADCIAAEAACVQACLSSFGLSRLGASTVLVLWCLVGCAPPPPAPLAGADPADPNSSGPTTGYRSAVGPYTPLRPTAPSPPGEGTDKTTPAPKASP
jgi:hypothetical protein